MARIRTIKPEFPQSQSMSRVCREARLTFILLWPQCDDHGKFRGASRMLASLLYPYDDDAPKRIDAWLDELERERCIERYKVDGNDYLKVVNWEDHQKIDRPSASRFPDPREDDRSLANDREASSQDQGSRTEDQGPRTEDHHSTAAKPGADKRGTRLKDDWQLTPELRIFASDLGLEPNGLRDEFLDYWTSVPGSKGLKLDWNKTFKNRCRELGKKPLFGRGETTADRREREVQEAIERSKQQ